MVTVLSVIDCWCQIKWKRFSKIRFEIKLQLKTITWLCPGQRPQTEIWHQWLTWWENVDIRDTFIANFHKNKKIWPGKNIHMCMFSVNNWQQQYYSYKIIFVIILVSLNLFHLIWHQQSITDSTVTIKRRKYESKAIF
jgi:hypothetical protein